MQRHLHSSENGASFVVAGGNNVMNFAPGSSNRSHVSTTAPAGTGDSENLQPYLVFNYVVKT